jgi:hypothetical protein
MLRGMGQRYKLTIEMVRGIILAEMPLKKAR